MLQQSSYARVTAADIAAIERRVQALEKRLERLSSSTGRASLSVSQATERIGEVIAAALGEAADRFRGGARSVGDEAARVGHEAARVGNDALRRISEEVEHRPLFMLAIAAGVGFLAGLVGRRG